MSDDMFIAVELNQWKAEAAEREKDKKSWVEYHVRRKATLPNVDRIKTELENNVGQLKSKELEVLLRWKGMPVSKIENIAARCILHQQFAEGGAEEVGIPASWTEINEAELILLRDAPIAICNSAYSGLRRKEEGHGTSIQEDVRRGEGGV
jgi:hypothetical protein